MIRVLHYGLGSNRGGIETYLLGLASHLVGVDFKFDFVYTDTGSKPCFHDELAKMGSQFYSLTPRRTALVRNKMELETIFRSGFDVLHCHLNTFSYVAPIQAALRQHIPVIIHSHNAGASRSFVTRALHSINKLIVPLNRTTNVGVSSEAGKWLFGSSKFEIIHNGIDADVYRFSATARAESRRALDLSGSLTLGHVGAFLPAKNHTFLLRVFKEVLAKRSDSSLILIGSGPLEEATRREADGLGVLHRVRFLGQRTDVPQLLSAMDALVLPSLHEGLPISVLEAQASGLPCFVSVHVTPEVITTKASHRLALRSPSEWAEAIINRDQTFSRESGAAEIVAAGFDSAHSAALVGETYARVVRDTARS